jgi:hypothetical protein
MPRPCVGPRDRRDDTRRNVCNRALLPSQRQTIIIADGPGANLFATVYRAVLGGTRGYESVSGQLIEWNLGLNKTGACNLRITFNLKRSRGERHEGF